MEKITLNEYLKQGSVVENLKKFVGVTPENTVGLMTPERLAAVAGEKILNATRLTSGDLNDYKQPCILMVGSLPVANKPENFVYVIVLSSDSSEDCVQIAFSISKQLLYVRSFNSKSWSEWKSIGNIGA